MKHLKWAICVVALMGILLMVSVFGPIFGRAIESTWWPVLRYTSMELDSRDANGVTFSWYGVKVRDCRLIEVGALVLREGNWARADFTINGEPPGMRYRPVGRHDFGSWRVEPTGTRVKLIAVHSCHPLWDTASTMGDWPL